MLALDGPDDSEAEVLSERVGAAIGAELAALGFDLDFAPVLDVLTNPDNPVIGDRAFSREPERAALRALAFARGLERCGVLACGKHFPGHGDTATDSHLELPRIGHDLERIRAVELVPFRRAVAAGLPMLMTAHVVATALDPERPATLSPAVIAKCLQGELGYRGLVVSDDLDMKAISDHYGAGQAAVEALEAGCHTLLACRDPDNQGAAWEALVTRAESDASFRECVGRAAAAVRELKRAHFARSRRVEADAGAARRILARAEHRALAEELRRV